MKKIVFLTCGWIMVALGVLGMFLPVLPTTPFLLLAALFFDRSSPRFHRMLCANRYLGCYLENFRSGRGIPFQLKVKSIGVLWTMLALSSLFWFNWYYWAMLGLVGIGVTIHLACLKTCREAPPAFTLVELLVSITIIAILAGMLLPGLNQARTRARAAACRSNLRELAQANLFYAGEYADYFVPYSLNPVVNASGQLWLGYQTVDGGGEHGMSGANSGKIDFTRNPLLGQYLGKDGIVAVCPEERGRVTDLSATDFGGGYGYNALWLGRYVSDGAAFVLRAGSIRNASAMVMFADNARTTMGPFSFDPPQLAPYLYCRAKPNLWGGEYESGTTAGRHSGQVSVAWVDGHVSAEQVTRVNPDPASRKFNVGHLGTEKFDPYKAEL